MHEIAEKVHRRSMIFLFTDMFQTSEDDTKDILTNSIKKIMYGTPSFNEMGTSGFDVPEEVQEVISYNSRNLGRTLRATPTLTRSLTRFVRNSEGRLVEMHGGGQRVRRG